MKKKISKSLYWIPRILAIIFLVFLAMFSLDIFDIATTAKEIAIGLFMHNIPVLILLIVLIISWKYEIVGGIFYILAGFALIALKWHATSLIVAGPAFIIGTLFLINWFKKRKLK